MINWNATYEKILTLIDKAKIPTAYVLFIYITSVQYIPSEWISEEFKEKSLLPFAIPLGLIILKIFFDIYKKINEPVENLPFYKDWKTLTKSNDLLNAFEKKLDDDKIINIKAIGVSLRNYWATIKILIDEYVAEDKNYEFR
ncbi:hypothetical protein, partial [Winogradskyella sp.]|uniref:hypothetical protein n=1 Tax=Winogradskyella sp. TaxID=1883156 RepID=UPI0025F30579